MPFKKRGENTKSAAERRIETQALASDIPGDLRILEIKVQNMMKVKMAHFRPDEHLVVVSGGNGQGKTSLMQSIAWALTGVGTVTTEPIRKGERWGRIEIDLGEIVVTRQFTRVENSSKGIRWNPFFEVAGKHGEVYGSPQALLTGLMGKIAFDPLQFLRMKSDAQLEMLRQLVTFDVDIAALEAQIKADYDARREAGRVHEAAKARLYSLPVPAPGLPEEPIDVEVLTKKLQDAANHNSVVAATESKKKRLLEDREGLLKLARRSYEQAEALRREADALDAQGQRQEEQAEDSRQAAEAIEIPELIDTAEVAAEMTRANAINAAIQKATTYNAAEAETVKALDKWKELDAAVKQGQEDREAAIARAKMPIEGLSIGEDEVVYQGLPFSQASNAEQIRVSMALGMASNPKVRVLLIRDGSLLDSASMELVHEAAKASNFQVWVERVDTNSTTGIRMEDGEAQGEGVLA